MGGCRWFVNDCFSKFLEVDRLGLEPPVRRTDRPAAPPQWVIETHTCVTRASTRRKPCAKESTVLGVRTPQQPLPLPCYFAAGSHAKRPIECASPRDHSSRRP